MIDEKEKTALAASVGADERQPFQPCDTQIITTENAEINYPDEIFSKEYEEISRQMQRMNDPAYLHTVSMNELYETVYQSRPPVIDGLLYSGTYLFAGAPKVGKSFFMAQLAYHISTGQKLWDYDVRQGTVLYLALEDDYQRLQERMSRMFGVEGTDNLFFAVYAKQLGAGLDEQLEKFIREHPDTRLIIIDTLQKIREISTDAYSYANDYDIVGRMKQFADRYGICLLLVHHTRKQQAGDKFEMISGTTGLLGCADGAFLLQKEKRTDLSATLEIVGRDQPDQKLHLTRDTEKLIWQLDHAETELWKKPPDPLLDKIAAVITEGNPVWSGSATELVTLLGEDIQPNILTRRLNVKAGDLLNEYGIEYAMKRTRTGSSIMVALYKNSAVAIECDGERWHSGEDAIRADMERQTILERLGWRFIRIRGSEYYRDTEQTMERVKDELSNYGIEPEETTTVDEESQNDTDLLKRVRQRAAMILENTTKVDNGNNIMTIEVALNPKALFQEEAVPSVGEQPNELEEEVKEKATSEESEVEQTSVAPEQQKKDILELLQKHDVPYIDKRQNAGALWIVGGSELNAIVQEAKEYGCNFVFAKDGGKATKGKPGWWTK